LQRFADPPAVLKQARSLGLPVQGDAVTPFGARVEVRCA
jgi:hypothetical protein